MMRKNAFGNWRLGVGVLLVVSLSIIFATALMAQTSATGALTGTVRDQSGAVIANATVTATSADTGQARTAMTGTDGTYKFNLLSPGNYRVRIEAAGFKAAEIPSATVSVTETRVLDRALEVGAVSQTVTVEAGVETIETTSSALGTVMTSRSMTELPLNTRNYTNLLAMSTGVSADVQNATLLGKGATRMSVNGGSSGQNAYQMDGVAINNWAGFGGVAEGVTTGTFAMPNPDAIAEFKIQTSTYDAGYGRNPGANVNVVTKSGTNSFHGSAFEFFRNTALNANDWFLNRSNTPRPVLNSNEYGGAIGGPIKKDKLFFFVSYQENDQKNGLSAFSDSAAILPPIPNGNRGSCNGGQPGWYTIAACDAAGQSFVQNLATVSSSSTPKIGTVPIQNPAACPCDPAGLFNMNPIAISLLQAKLPDGSFLIPGSGTSGYAPRDFVSPSYFKDHQAIGNIDYVINSKHSLAVRYIFETDPLSAPFGVPNAQEPGFALPGSPITATKTNQDVIVKLTSLLSNNLVNEFHAAYQRDVAASTKATPFTSSQFGIADFFSPFAPAGKSDVLSDITINGGLTTGLLTIGPFSSYGGLVRNNQFTVGDQISWTHGPHTFRTGVEGQRVQVARLSYYGSGGAPTFNSFADLLIGRAGCGIGVITPSAANPGGCNGSSASSMTSQSVAGRSAAANSNVQTNPRVFFLSAFIQDDIKVNARFTLNLGLRWELDQFATEANGNSGTFLTSLANIAPPPFVTVPGGAGESLAGYMLTSNYSGPIIPAGVYQSNSPYFPGRGAPWDNFAPRIGFAWQPTSSNRLVVRGGAGYFYDVISSSSGSNCSSPLAPSLTGRLLRVCLTRGRSRREWFLPVTAASGSCLAG